MKFIQFILLIIHLENSTTPIFRNLKLRCKREKKMT